MKNVLPTALLAICFAINLNLSPIQAQETVVELPVGADYCAILRAFTDQEDARCPRIQPLGGPRSLGPEPKNSFPKDAASLASAGGEKGYFIRFAFNSVELNAEYRAHLERLSSVFQSPAMKGVCIKLMGHTDSVGSENYNLRLSIARAQMVRAFLIQRTGLQGTRVVSVGAGETKPLANIPSGHPLNRRVEILARAQNGENCV